MKKLLLFLIFVFVFSGCSKADIPEPQEVEKAFEKDFFASVTAGYGGGKTKMEINKNGMSISVDVLSPSDLKGLFVEISGEHAKVKYENIEQTIETEELPEEAPFLLLEELFDDLSDSEDFVLSNENGRLFAKNPDFTVELSADDYSVISAVFPEYEVRFDFSKFVFFEKN